MLARPAARGAYHWRAPRRARRPPSTRAPPPRRRGPGRRPRGRTARACPPLCPGAARVGGGGSARLRRALSRRGFLAPGLFDARGRLGGHAALACPSPSAPPSLGPAGGGARSTSAALWASYSRMRPSRPPVTSTPGLEGCQACWRAAVRAAAVEARGASKAGMAQPLLIGVARSCGHESCHHPACPHPNQPLRHAPRPTWQSMGLVWPRVMDGTLPAGPGPPKSQIMHWLPPLLANSGLPSTLTPKSARFTCGRPWGGAGHFKEAALEGQGVSPPHTCAAHGPLRALGRVGAAA
jgi:hypothetical protein